MSDKLTREREAGEFTDTLARYANAVAALENVRAIVAMGAAPASITAEHEGKVEATKADLLAVVDRLRYERDTLAKDLDSAYRTIAQADRRLMDETGRGLA